MPDASQKPTINDVARVAGVSKKTVSRVINRSPLLKQETRTKVEGVIAELGYRPNPQARAFAMGRNFLIGLLHDNPNAQTVLNFQVGVLDAIRDTEFALVVRPVDRRSPHMLDDIRSFLEIQRLFGVLILPPISENDDLARLCREMGCGYVRMGSARLDDDEHLVQSNDRECVESVIDHLVANGHRRIAIIKGPDGFRSAQERAEGFAAAMKKHGLEIPPEAIGSGNYRFDSGIVAAEKLLDTGNPPTAIFASNDEMAAGAFHAALARGIDVPSQLSVVGFDDSPIAAHILPPMTTVSWPIREMAKSAAFKLIEPTNPAAGLSTFPARLVVRNSVAAPRE